MTELLELLQYVDQLSLGGALILLTWMHHRQLERRDDKFTASIDRLTDAIHELRKR